MAQYLKSAPPTTFADRTQRDVAERVSQIIADVRSRGEAAVREYSGRFDSWTPDRFRLGEDQVQALVGSLPQQVIDDIEFVQARCAGSRRCSETPCRTWRSRPFPACASVTGTYRSPPREPTCPAADTR